MDRDVAIEVIKRLHFDLSRANLSKSSVMVPCINHIDKSPSCSVSLDKGGYHCFSCGAGGSLFSLYLEHTGRSIYEELGISNGNRDDFVLGGRANNLQPINHELTPNSKIRYEGNDVLAWNHPASRDYLTGRGITQEVSQEMQMRFSISGKVVDTLDSDTKENYVEYINRLVIPIREKGQNLSFEGRDILGKDKFVAKYEGETYKKVLYPKGSSTSTLFQLEKLSFTEPLYFVEGLMSLGALRTSKYFKNSTAVFGASISHRQVYLLNKFQEKIYLIDNDYAGWCSLLNLGKQLKQLNQAQVLGKADRDIGLSFIVSPEGSNDVGDIPQKLKMTIDECYDKKGFARRIVFNEKEIQAKVTELKVANDLAKKLKEKK